MNDKVKEKPEEIGQRVFSFVVAVLQAIKTLPKNETNRIIILQLIRCVTSIGANIEEARGEHTKSDFAHSMNIAKKEAFETRYWMRLLIKMNENYSKKFDKLLQENEEIIKILITIVKKSNPRSFV